MFCSRRLFFAITLLVSMCEADILQAEDSKPKPAPVVASDEENLWTADDVKIMCTGRWKHQRTAIKDCIERNKRKIGEEMNPGDLQEIAAQKPDTATPKK